MTRVDGMVSGLVSGLMSGTLMAALAITAHAQAPLRFGQSISMTGSYAAIGQNVLRGVKLCVKDTNKRGGLLGRRIDLTVKDDQSQPKESVRIYEEFLAGKKVDVLLSPYSSTITNAVADVVEKYRMPMVASSAATTAIFRKGRKYIFMFTTPAENYLIGLIDLARKQGLKTVAVLHEDTLLPRAITKGVQKTAEENGLKVVLVQKYARGTKDFREQLRRIASLNPDVLAAPGYFNDAVGIVRQMKELGVNPKMFSVTSGGDLPKFQQTLGADANFVYAPTKWLPELVSMRAGGLIPVARQYPGAREFVEAHKAEYPGAGLSYQTAEGYGACQIMAEAIRRAGSLDGDKIRKTILEMDINTVFGGFRVNQDGVQVAHRMLSFQWQDGKKAVVWPEELAADRPRFPTPPWSKR